MASRFALSRFSVTRGALVASSFGLEISGNMPTLDSIWRRLGSVFGHGRAPMRAFGSRRPARRPRLQGLILVPLAYGRFALACHRRHRPATSFWKDLSHQRSRGPRLFPAAIDGEFIVPLRRRPSIAVLVLQVAAHAISAAIQERGLLQRRLRNLLQGHRALANRQISHYNRCP